MPIITIFYITLAFLLLYDCSAYSNSQGSYNTYYYSNYFNSNYFNSGSVGFNSNAFNSRSFVSSDIFKYISFVGSNTLVSSSSFVILESSNYKSFVSSKSIKNFDPYLSLINSSPSIQSQSKTYSISSSISSKSSSISSSISSKSWNNLLSVIKESFHISVSTATYMPSVSPTYMPQIPTQIVTVAPTWAPTSLSPTIAPTSAPTYMPQIPTQIVTVAPTWSPTSLLPTVAPTSLSQTIAPTSQPILVPIISFTSDLTISNVQTNYLDSLAQESIVIATANSMNISADFVTFVSSSVSKDIKISNIRLLSFNLIATTKTSIPLQDKYSTFISNPTSLYTSLSNTMNAAVSNGVFTNYLVAASLKMNSTATVSASIASITISSVTIETNGSISPTSIPTSYTIGITTPNNTDYYYILLYTFVSFVLFFALIYIIVKCYINYKQRRMRLILSKCMSQFLQRQNRERRQGQRKIQIQRKRQIGETINTENIELLIVNNE